MLSDFAKDNAELRVKAAAMGGKLMSAAEIDSLAKLPPREQLLAMLLGTMKAPAQQLVQVLNEVPARFVRTLAAVSERKDAAGRTIYQTNQAFGD